jgi:hypothetical protein
VKRTIRFDTIEPSVPVTASWAPITSLFNRLMRAPVWLRVKKAIDWFCTRSKSWTRRWWMTPSPMWAENHRCTTASTASNRAAPTMNEASNQTSPRSCRGIARSTIERKSSGGSRASTASMMMVTRNAAIHQRNGLTTRQARSAMRRSSDLFFTAAASVHKKLGGWPCTAFRLGR